MITKRIYKIFKKGSVTYFYSSLFFPKNIKEDVFVLYAFVRSVDDFVDQVPQNKKGFNDFYNLYKKALTGGHSKNNIVYSFVSLKNKHKIDDDLVESFFDSMLKDFKVNKYEDIDELENYIYGSAEVIGLMMAKILNLPKKSYTHAKVLGKSMQFANFIRDIKEDLDINRQYIPVSDLSKFKLTSLDESVIKKNTSSFKQLIQYECERYDKWQRKAEKGFEYIPKRLLVPIKTSSDMYKWTIEEIRNNPMIIYEKQLKPSIFRVVGVAVINSITIMFSPSYNTKETLK